jgi:hypothetical protein
VTLYTSENIKHRRADDFLLFNTRFVIVPISWGGVRLSPLGTSATVGLLYQPRMIDDDDYVAVGGMRIGRGNRSTRRKPAPVPLYPPQIPHDLGSNPGLRGGKPASNRLSHGTASSVSMVMVYELDGQGSIPGKGKRFLSTP